MIELALCAQRDDLQGIYLSPSYSNPQVWFGLIYVRYGTYSGAAYRFIMLLGDTEYDHQNVNFHKTSQSSSTNVNSNSSYNTGASSSSYNQNQRISSTESSHSTSSLYNTDTSNQQENPT